MTDRLREKARELVNAIGFDSMSAAMSYAGAEAATYAALLSARDEALEEAAAISSGLDFRLFGFPDDEANGGDADEGTVGFCVASIAISQRIRSLKSKVRP